MYYGSGNPSTWNPAQRPGDNKWSMSIWARDVDTGKVELGVPDDAVRRVGLRRHQRDDPCGPYHQGHEARGAGALRSQRIRLHARPHRRRAAGSREVRSGGELGHQRRHEDRPPAGRGEVQHGAERTGREHQGHLPGRAGLQGPAAGRVPPEHQAVLRADQPRVHGLRAVRGRVRRRPALRRARRCRCIRRPARRTWATSSPGMRPSARSSGPSRRSSRSGAARWPPPATSCSTARWKATSRPWTPRPARSCGSSSTPSGIIGNVFTYQHAASSTSACSPASAAGPASAWRRVWRRTPTVWVRSAATKSCASTPIWVVS